MIRPPKALTIGADDHGSFKALYVGDDVVKASALVDDPPVSILQIFFYRNGVIQRARETEAARVIQDAQIEAARKEAEAARKAAEAAAEKEASALAAKAAAAKAAGDKARKDSDAAALAAHNKRNAEILQAAAAKAKALATATTAAK
jgi:hypothetical protein